MELKRVIGWLFNIVSIIGLILFFRWGRLPALVGMVIGAVVATMLLSTNKGRTALTLIDHSTRKPIWKFK